MKRPTWAWLTLPVSLACTECGSCGAPDASAVAVEGKTETGLLRIAKATDTARVGVVRAEGTSVFFSNDFIPRSSSSTSMSGQVWVARSSVEISFSDREGNVQTVVANPGAPGRWSGTVRLARPAQGNNGFYLRIVPLSGTPAQADGVVVEVVYSAS